MRAYKYEKDKPKIPFGGDVYSTEHRGKFGYAVDTDGRVYLNGKMVGIYHDLKIEANEMELQNTTYQTPKGDRNYYHSLPKEGRKYQRMTIRYYDIWKMAHVNVAPFTQEEYDALLTDGIKHEGYMCKDGYFTKSKEA